MEKKGNKRRKLAKLRESIESTESTELLELNSIYIPPEIFTDEIFPHFSLKENFLKMALVSKELKKCSELSTTYPTNSYYLNVPFDLSEEELLKKLRLYKGINKLNLSEWLYEQSVLKIEERIQKDIDQGIKNIEDLEDFQGYEEEGIDEYDEYEIEKKKTQNELLQKIIESCSSEDGICRLEKLDLSNTLISSINENPDINIGKLKNLNLNCCKNVLSSKNSFEGIMRATANDYDYESSLEKLFLEIDGDSNDLFETENSLEVIGNLPKLINLTSLYIKNVLIVGKDLLEIIKKTTVINKTNNSKESSLEKLILKDIPAQLDNINEFPNFPKLKKFVSEYTNSELIKDILSNDLSGDMIEIKDLSVLLKKAPNLEYIKCYYKNKNGERTLFEETGKNQIRVSMKKIRKTFNQNFNITF